MRVGGPLRRVAMISVHTSPLDQPGGGDAGGMNVYVRGLSEALVRRGVEVEVFTRATSSAQAPVVRTPEGVLVRHVAAGPFEGLPKDDLPAQLCAFTAELLRVEAAMEPGWFGAVHTHYWLSGQVGWLAADRWDVPLVHTMHTLALLKNAALAPGDAPEPLGRILGEEQVVAEADALVASTPDEGRALVADYAADPDRVHVVPPGVDLGTFRPVGDRDALRRELDLPPGPLVLFAGRVQPLKAPDVLVRALQHLGARTDLPGPVTLVVLGGASGRGTAVRELEALAHQLGVADRLVVRPPVDRPRLARHYRAADLVAVPSHSETFGLVAAEAQACGTPVVAAAVGGLRTVVVDGVSGVLVPGHDPRQWARALGDLLADPVRRAALAAGAPGVSARFGWDTAAERMLGVYESATGVRAGRRCRTPGPGSSASASAPSTGR